MCWELECQGECSTIKMDPSHLLNAFCQIITLLSTYHPWCYHSPILSRERVPLSCLGGTAFLSKGNSNLVQGGYPYPVLELPYPLQGYSWKEPGTGDWFTPTEGTWDQRLGHPHCWRTDICENITSRRTSYEGGKNLTKIKTLDPFFMQSVIFQTWRQELMFFLTNILSHCHRWK